MSLEWWLHCHFIDPDRKAADDAYWNQTEHPSLVECVCSCGEPHLNDPLVGGPMCPKCMEEFIMIGHGMDPDGD